MSAHTPGPWFVSETARLEACVQTRPDPATGDLIAVFYEHAWDGNSEANARLVAAAPEMLAALREVLESVAACHCEGAWTDRELHAPECHYDEVDFVRAAVAKAEGLP